jgi:Fic family protein
VKFTVKKSQFFKAYSQFLNNRQLKAVNRMFEEGPEGFEGGMNTAKYMGITKASKATATRDLQEAKELGWFIQSGGGRSTSYQLNL